MIEKWAAIPGYEGLYEVSDHGRVRSLDRHVSVSGTNGRPIKGRMMSPCIDREGYHSVHLYSDGKRKPRWIATIVAEVFIGPRGPGMEVCHCDGNKTNNHWANLRYDTRAGNLRDKVRHGTHREGEEINFAKLKGEDVREIKSLLGRLTHADIAQKFGVSRPAVSLIAEGKTWRHIS